MKKQLNLFLKEKEKWQASVASGDKRNFNFNTLSDEPLKFVIFQKNQAKSMLKKMVSLVNSHIPEEFIQTYIVVNCGQ